MRTLAILCLVSASLFGRTHAPAQPLEARVSPTLEPQTGSPVPPRPTDWSWVFSPSPVETGEGRGGGSSSPLEMAEGRGGGSPSPVDDRRPVGAANRAAGGEDSTGSAGAVLEMRRWVFLPLLTRDIEPQVYDDFENRAYEGTYNPLLWNFGADSKGSNIFRAYQQSGVMVFRNKSADVSRAAGLGLLQPKQRSLAEMQFFEAKLKLGGERTGGWSEVSLMVISNNVAGHGWLVQCGMGGRTREPTATPFCNVSTNAQSPDWPPEYLIYDAFATPYDTWHTVRIEVDPGTAEFTFLLDGEVFGSYVPKDAKALVKTYNLEPMVQVYTGDPDTTATYWADDVKITSAE
jgi:hypothetical protein